MSFDKSTQLRQPNPSLEVDILVTLENPFRPHSCPSPPLLQRQLLFWFFSTMDELYLS